MTEQMTYANVGVNYDAMDPFKRMAQSVACSTANQLNRFGFSEVAASRGESAYLIETPFGYLSHVEEGLGTKNLVADEMYRLTGKTYYDSVAQDTVAMIVNDMITLGAMPISIAMHLAVASSDWFADALRCKDLVEGWRHACELSRAVYSGGETPTLKDVVVPGASLLSGSAVGFAPKDRIISGNIQDGDAILLIESSGIHANGLTMARKIAERLPEGYLTKLRDGRTYGASLLDPTCIYVGLVDDCLREGVNIHYAVNVTGHGWRKLMRAVQPFAYIINSLPPRIPIFDFLQQHGPLSDEEAYGNLNMGAGFALYVPQSEVSRVISISHANHLSVCWAGHIEASDEKRVEIRPRGLVYSGETLGVR